MVNINDSYFDGYYKEIWRSLIPPVVTPKEIEFIHSYFNLKPGSKVLDLMCGFGRHALALAEAGAAITAVDNLEDYITEIEEKSREKKLLIKTVKANIVDYTPSEIFDLAICMGNSLCFFDRSDSIKIMKTVARHLETGGFFLINTWSIAEIVYRNFVERSWSHLKDAKFLTESKVQFEPSRIETENTILLPDGSQEKKKAVDYVYTIGELKEMLSESGLKYKETFSIPGRKKFEFGDPRAYIVACKF
jgi:SAM-dependent methyltransferase